MSREIKFRAWDKLTRIIVPYEEMSCHKSKFEYGRRALLSGFLQNPDYEVMQFTGLKDKNGVEIFEGDVVVAQEYQAPMKVIWGYCGWGLQYLDTRSAPGFTDWINKLRVVGNIFQNPELLEDSK